MFDVVGVVPGTIYSFTIDASASGVGTAGVAFYDSAWKALQAPSFKVHHHLCTCRQRKPLFPPTPASLSSLSFLVANPMFRIIR